MSLTFVDKKYIASGNDVLSANYIAKESFSAVCPLREAGSWMDANGTRHPDYMPTRVLTVTFSTPQLDDAQLDTLRSWFTTRFSSGTRKVSITAWCADEGSYITQDCDLVEFSPVHDRRLNSTDGNAYKSFKIKLQGRGGTIS